MSFALPRLDRINRFGLLLLVVLTLLAVEHRSTAEAATPFTVFDEQLAAGWQNCSWDAGVDFASSTAQSGSKSIGLDVWGSGGGLCLMAPGPVDITGLGYLHFFARSTSASARYQVFLYDNAYQPTGYVWLANAGGDPPLNTWREYKIALGSLNAGTSIRGFGLQRIDGGTGAPLNLDGLAFTTPDPPALPSPTPTSTPAPQVGSLVVYGDALAGGWNSCSWSGQLNLASTSPVLTGTKAIAFKPTAPRAGVCLMASTAFNTTVYETLHFAVRSARDGQHYQVWLYGPNGQPTGQYVSLASFGGDPGSTGWNTYDIPLSLLGGARTDIKGFAIQTIDAGTTDSFYVDDLTFVAAPPAITPDAAPAPLALGAYVHGAPQSATALDAYSSLSGATPAIVMWYQGWGLLKPGNFDATAMNLVVSRGATPMVTWMPWGDSDSVNQPYFAMSQIAAGRFDSYVRRWAQAAAAWNKPLYLRFAHEMNGNWYPWAVGVNGTQAADYIAAWRHVHDIFVQAGATNVRWVWSPNVVGPGAGQFTSMYPGDAYVDWVAIGGYNWGASKPGATWQSFTDVFAYSYDTIVGMTSKPLMIAETASTEHGGNKADWIRQGLLTDLPGRMPRVRALIWFNENKETDWRINSSSSSLAAFREIAASALYKARLP